MEEELAESSSVIASFIKRFREAPPTSPHHRSNPQDRNAFWWIQKDLSEVNDVVKDKDNCTAEENSDLLLENSEQTIIESMNDDTLIMVEEQKEEEQLDSDRHDFNISEGEIPRSDIPVRIEDVIPPPPPSVDQKADPSLHLVISSAADPIRRIVRGNDIAITRFDDDYKPGASILDQFYLKAESQRGPLPAIEMTPPTQSLDAILDNEQDIYYDCGMEELDERTNALLQKCEAVLQTFQAKDESLIIAGSDVPPPNLQRATEAKDDRDDSSLRELATGPFSTSSEFFQGARANAIARKSEEGSPKDGIQSPVRGLQGINDSIFSLTSVVSDEDCKSRDTSAASQIPDVPNIKSSVGMSPHDVTDAVDVEPGEKESEGRDQLPEARLADTPPRRESSRNRRKGRPQLASPESVRSVNGMSLDNSGLFLFLSSSEENGVKSSACGDSKDSPDAVLSRSSASYSEDYHNLMKSLQEVEVLRACEVGNDINGLKHIRNENIAHAHRGRDTKYSNTEVSANLVVNADTVKPYLEDEIVNVLWKQLVAHRIEIRRRAENL